MDVNKAVRFVLDDKQWISKLLIGVLMSVLAFLIVPGLILQGYLVKVIRQVMGGNDNELPEWTDWGKLLSDGLFVTLGQIIWTLPFILLFVVGGLATGGLGSMADRGSDIATAGVMGGGLLLICLAVLFAVVFLFLTPALMIQYAIKDEFGAMFRFGEVFDIIRNHTADILIAFLVTLAAVVVIGVVTGVLAVIPCLGWIAAAVIGLAMGPYLTFVTGHLYGQIARKVGGGKAAVYEKGPDVV